MIYSGKTQARVKILPIEDCSWDWSMKETYSPYDQLYQSGYKDFLLTKWWPCCLHLAFCCSLTPTILLPHGHRHYCHHRHHCHDDED